MTNSWKTADGQWLNEEEEERDRITEHLIHKVGKWCSHKLMHFTAATAVLLATLMKSVI